MISQFHSLRNKKRSITTVLEQVSHSSGRDMCKLLSSRDDDSLDVRSKLTVRIGNGSLRLEIDHIPDATYDMPYAKFTACIDCKIVIVDNADTFKSGSSLSDDVHLLVKREESPLVYVYTHSNNDFIKHGQSPLQDIEMACCERIE